MDCGASVKKSLSSCQLVGFPAPQNIISWDFDRFLTTIKAFASFVVRLRMCGQIWNPYMLHHALRLSKTREWTLVPIMRKRAEGGKKFIAE